MMPSCLSILFRALRIEWRETKRTLFPTTPIETGLFLFFFLLYGCIGYRMLFHTELIDVPNGGAGSYLGYDNLFHLHTRGGAFDISHPFFGIFHLLKTLLTILLTTLFKEKTSGIICLTLMNLLIPADSNWFSNRADEDPTDSIRTEIRGPRPASRGEPVRLPTGMDNSLAET